MSICDIQTANVIDALTPLTSSHSRRRLVKAWLTLVVSTYLTIILDVSHGGDEL